MYRLQPLVDIAELCHRQGLRDVILSPGSRCAPLTLAFARHPHLRVRSIPDERAAAFIALGLAQQTGQPVVLVCTSGTAALNYGPAVAEAFYQNVPLLLLTADRPPEWIDQWDGQTIRQAHVYGRHAKWSRELPVSYEHPDAAWHINRQVNEAINYARETPAGPVHLNIPVREPFYPDPAEPYGYSDAVRVIAMSADAPELSEAQYRALRDEWQTYERILVVAGQGRPTAAFRQVLKRLSEKTGAVLVGDVLSNLHDLPGVVDRPDALLMKGEQAALQPDLLITFGQSVISKNLKLFLRKHAPRAHWHVQPAGEVPDTFQTLTRVIRTEPSRFFSRVSRGLRASPRSYAETWRAANQRVRQATDRFFQHQPFGEFGALSAVVQHLPKGTQVHVANSMAIRYVNFLGLPARRDLTLFANRGTSGIDGSSSTAVGAALATNQPVVLITGDLAFFYDRNAFWHQEPLPNLRIVLLNNHGGGIFRMIDGPRQQPELEPFFETRQALRAENTARDFGMTYYFAEGKEALRRHLPDFFNQTSDRPRLLEIETHNLTNADVFDQYKQMLRAGEKL
ncbi:2-succinyl-5-enolpyruvyl-6-hydroxy-3-cyclohexene-1-carboxylate synthase [Catalinimonas alkaloidigena]|uniref:2-succinyl-5-enolpyruvyl-6-hydroxy-3-cyclohexene-1-carboxylate synthase n=1 Tax=Catalinimonas alkaloidigena TaxID=1075417 RepID=A0A1G9GVY5_9BACT|nr:2-succinyl-5-enolpyruvyl-6-hydroxy-3-cyclohexene-1-carboxylic-acid synthase [Catalinimonas alkaloidigena]SDL04826.1 2-succinyl-5-enolpyruvyl-6-hydroxy-3-cyclohexene-1-carboxylate synthase [Catalinimonas alkaloidigena]